VPQLQNVPSELNVEVVARHLSGGSGGRVAAGSSDRGRRVVFGDGGENRRSHDEVELSRTFGRYPPRAQ